MAEDTLEVVLVNAKGLENTDFLSGGDPYAVLTCRTQEKKRSVASGHRTGETTGSIGSNHDRTGQGSCPEWNETFLFYISGGVDQLRVKIMDKDTLTEDDIVGEATIPLEPVFAEENIPPMSYNVVKNEQYCGEVRIGLKFTPQRSRGFCVDEENIGGWRQSSLE